MDDTQLAHRLSRDLDGTFESLVHAHVDRCHAIAHRMTGNPHDAEEITQDALVRAYRALATYDPERIRDLRTLQDAANLGSGGLTFFKDLLGVGRLWDM